MMKRRMDDHHKARWRYGDIEQVTGLSRHLVKKYFRLLKIKRIDNASKAHEFRYRDVMRLKKYIETGDVDDQEDLF